MTAGAICSNATEEWVLSEDVLAQLREAAHTAAAQALQAAAGEAKDRRTAVPKPIGLEEGLRLVCFYAQKIPELCDLCSAPAEVRWSAVVFYRRFFAVRSPMEFDPLPLMFASVHLACKVEELHAITLDTLLEAAGFAADEGLKGKVTSLELPLLEGVGFALLVEPKPDTALRMLAQELDTEVADDALARAEGLVLDLSVRSDAVLRWPTSLLVVAALGVALGESSEPLVAALEKKLQGASLAGKLAEAMRGVQRLAEEEAVTEGAVKETAKVARKCHRAFERSRELAAERHEAVREAVKKEKKRRRIEV